MQIALITSLIVSNIAWLVFFSRLLESQRDERRELENRIVRPDVLVHKTDKKPVEEKGFSYADNGEYAKVGTINYDEVIEEATKE